MKRCSKCGIVQPDSAFHRERRYGLQAWCKTCRRIYDRAYHLATKERRLPQKRRWKRAQTEWSWTLKAGRPCSDCGGSFHPAAMQWDHRPGTVKIKDVSSM